MTDRATDRAMASARELVIHFLDMVFLLGYPVWGLGRYAPNLGGTGQDLMRKGFSSHEGGKSELTGLAGETTGLAGIS
jgi:hypothetical protein